jgi:AAA15 family ATPase/GTPase
MIKSLHIQNFKSIKDLKLDCARVNLFIGEPNTGKSNILESIGVFSLPNERDLKNLIRIDKNFNIFQNENTEEKIKIELLLNDETQIYFEFSYHRGMVIAECKDVKKNMILFEFILTPDIQYAENPKFVYSQYIPIRFYKFKELKKFEGYERDYLTPPFGENLPQIIMQNHELKEFVSSLFKKVGYKVEIDRHENMIKIYREGHITESIPFFLTSDTLQRMIFYNAAITSNKEAILIFEEPESHMFPFYNEQLALMIADNSNQFFIATHNPYFLNMLINKTKAEELGVFKVTYKDYQTVAKPIEKKVLQNFVINDNDILLNIDRLGED